MVKKITTTELRQGKINGGIIFQGCAEPHEDWVNGVNEMLTDEGILLEGTKYKPDDVYSFEHEGITNLVFPFEPVKLDIGKLAMWRLATHGTFSAKWVEDYVDNRLGGPLRNDEPEQKKKPDCALIGQDGNIFNLMGIASRTLRKHGLKGNFSFAESNFKNVTTQGNSLSADVDAPSSFYGSTVNVQNMKVIVEYTETALSKIVITYQTANSTITTTYEFAV